MIIKYCCRVQTIPSEIEVPCDFHPLKVKENLLLFFLKMIGITITSYINVYEEHYSWRHYKKSFGDKIHHIYVMHNTTLEFWIASPLWDGTTPCHVTLLLGRGHKSCSYNLITAYPKSQRSNFESYRNCLGLPDIMWSFGHQHSLDMPGSMPSSLCVILTHGSMCVSH